AAADDPTVSTTFARSFSGLDPYRQRNRAPAPCSRVRSAGSDPAHEPGREDRFLLVIRSGNQFREHVRVDIASRQNDDDVLAARVDTTGQKCGEANRAARLDPQPQLPKCN